MTWSKNPNENIIFFEAFSYSGKQSELCSFSFLWEQGHDLEPLVQMKDETFNNVVLANCQK